MNKTLMNLTPRLMCDGFCNTFTRHAFVKEHCVACNDALKLAGFEVEEDENGESKKFDDKNVGYAQMFMCQDCGLDRRYGFTSKSIA